MAGIRPTSVIYPKTEYTIAVTRTRIETIELVVEARSVEDAIYEAKQLAREAHACNWGVPFEEFEAAEA